MFNQPNIPYQNALLRRLSPGDLASIEPNLERVALPMRTQLESTKSVIEHVYFLEVGSRQTTQGPGYGGRPDRHGRHDRSLSGPRRRSRRT